MKLADWAKKQGISYLTAYRWFKDGKFPVKAYQSESGTIIVQDETELSDNQANNAVSIFLKKTVEFSKNKASIEDFAAYVLTNFLLKSSNNLDALQYSKLKPKQEDIPNHFKQFIKLGEKPLSHTFVTPATNAIFEKLSATSTIPNVATTANISGPNLYQNLGPAISIYSESSSPHLQTMYPCNPAPLSFNCSSESNFDQIDQLKVIENIALEANKPNEEIKKNKRGRKPFKNK